MRNLAALTFLMLAAALAGCGKKAANEAVAPAPEPAANTPAPARAAAAAGPALPAVSADGCAVVAAYVKGEMMGDFGMPVMVRVAPAKGEVKPADLAGLKGLNSGEAKTLAQGLTRSIEAGGQLDCDWKALGLMAPTPLAPDGHAYIRFRPVVDGDVALLDAYTDAAGLTVIGNRCVFRRKAGAWTRDACALTALG